MGQAKWGALGGMDLRYDSLGGEANLDLYKRLLDLPGTPPVLLHGEGAFHQVHGGVSTNTPAGEREAVMAAIRAQDLIIRGEVAPPRAEPILFGPIHPAARRFLACRWRGPDGRVPRSAHARGRGAQGVRRGDGPRHAAAGDEHAPQPLRQLPAGRHQQGARAEDDEDVVVESRSADTLDPAGVEALPAPFRYLLRDEPGASPAAAISAGLAMVRGEVVGLMIDGARLVTPGVLGLVLTAGRIDPGAVVAVPGYQIGRTRQPLAPAHGEDADRALLAQAGRPPATACSACPP